MDGESCILMFLLGEFGTLLVPFISFSKRVGSWTNHQLRHSWMSSPESRQAGPKCNLTTYKTGDNNNNSHFIELLLSTKPFICIISLVLYYVLSLSFPHNNPVKWVLFLFSFDWLKIEVEGDQLSYLKPLSHLRSWTQSVWSQDAGS